MMRKCVNIEKNKYLEIQKLSQAGGKSAYKKKFAKKKSLGIN